MLLAGRISSFNAGTADGAGTLRFSSSGNTINGWVYRQADGLNNITAQDLAFNGAFAILNDAAV